MKPATEASKAITILRTLDKNLSLDVIRDDLYLYIR